MVCLGTQGKVVVYMPEPTIKNLSADLNIVLTPDDINLILKSVLGPHGERIPELALVSGHCCVDGSVGSSVAGPVSSVASSVSIIGHDLLVDGVVMPDIIAGMPGRPPVMVRGRFGPDAPTTKEKPEVKAKILLPEKLNIT